MSALTVLSANDLRTGQVVFWSQQSTWSPLAAEAKVAASEDERKALEGVISRAQTDIEVVGPYLISGDSDAMQAFVPITPKKMRERRRLLGPSASTTSMKLQAA